MKKFIMILVALLAMIAIDAKADIIRVGHSDSNDSETQNCCNARSFFGGLCKICVGACTEGNIRCTGGFWSARCFCYEDPFDFGIEVLPSPPSDEEIDYVNEGITYLINIGENNLANLATAVLNAVQSQNLTSYISAEENYINEFESLNSATQNQINIWIDAHAIY